ncbi:MAG: hypothetical protein JXQ75_14160 [Phycisphaerae bacterium]|nr:hypothetical protein [Phycisphaerae bacterium]
MMKSGWIEFISKHFLCIIAIIGLIAYGITYLEGCFGLPIRSDGEGYYAYLPSYLIHGDPSFEKLAAARYGGEIPRYTYIRRYPDTGRYLDSYTVGVAVLQAPFFILAHILTFVFQSPPGGFEWWRFNHPADGYSFFYQHAVGFSGLFYLLAGLFFLKRVLERHFAPGVVISVLLTLLFGTNLFHYGVGEGTMSHAYSFALCAALLWLVPRWYADPASRPGSMLLGVVIALLLLVRSLNLLLVIPVICLFGVVSWSDVRRRVGLWLHSCRPILLALAVAVVVLVPQFLMWKYATGRFLVYQYYDQQGFFDFLRPQIGAVLFSVRKGLFLWFPVTLFVVVGFLHLRRRVPEWFLSVVLYLAAQIYVIASYCYWWGGGGFGNRYVAESWAAAALPLGAFYASLSTRKARVIVGVAATVFVLWTLFLMKLYYTREIPHEGLDGQALFDIFWLRKEMILGWFR